MPLRQFSLPVHVLGRCCISYELYNQLLPMVLVSIQERLMTKMVRSKDVKTKGGIPETGEP